MENRVLIKDTTVAERKQIVEQAKDISKFLGHSSSGIADFYLNQYVDGTMELSEARSRFIRDYKEKKLGEEKQ